MVKKIKVSIVLLLLSITGFSQTIDYSFVVVGCNRVNATDTVNNPSTANLYHLNRMFTEVSQMNPLPKYLFMAGDVVLGYVADTVLLAKQLDAWKQVYLNSPLAATSVQLVVIPGNHETQNNTKFTAVANERVFVREMAPYIIGSNGPQATGLIPGTDSLTSDQSHLTYSFNYHGDHFVMIDTDPLGRDSRVPYHWIGQDVAQAKGAGARHIFTIGHKPAYPSSYTPTSGLVTYPAERDAYWNSLESNKCEAMFSAHNHLWDKVQPHAGKTWQIIAGNGGSAIDWPSTYTEPYYGYTLVNVYTNGHVTAKSMGHDIGATYTTPVPNNPTTVRDTVDLTWPTSVAPATTTKLVHYWNFNSVGNAVTVTSVNTDYSAKDKGVVAYGKISGTSNNYVQGYMDGVSPGDTINARMGALAGNGIRPRNPSDSMQLLFYIPTTGYQNIRLTYETQKSSASNGALNQLFDYSIDSAKTFITTGLPVLMDTTSISWEKIRLDLSSITSINNNSKVVFRLRFTGTATGTSGNDRFDNFTVEGDTVIVVSCTAVSIATQPVAQAPVVANSGMVTYAVTANGTGPFTYKWMENGNSIVDGGVYSGSNTASLTLTNPSANLNGNTYVCYITNCTGNNNVTSNSVTLTVNPPAQSSAAPKGLIHYWNFDNVSGTVTSVNADYSSVSTGVLSYTELPGTSSKYVPGYMDNISPGDTINARMNATGKVGGNGIRPRNPGDSMQIVFYIPTSHYQNIRIKYESERSNQGPTTQTYDYSLDSGKTFIQTDMPVTTYSAGLIWGLASLDLSSIAAVNNNSQLMFRIRYTAGNTTASNGNNRFDNVTVEGDTLVIPAVTVAASQTSICSGTNVTFSATPVNGGTAPVYQWQVNGATAGNNAPIFTSSTLANNDVVTAVMTSNAVGANPATVTSNAVTMKVDALPTTANAGDDQYVITNTATLAGNTALVGNGAWTVVSGTGIATNVNSPTSSVTGISTGKSQFAWTITSGICAASSDTVAIYMGSIPSVTAITGPDVVVANQSNVMFSVPQNLGYTYNWSIPSEATLVGGNTGNSINVNFGSTGGTISVIIANEFGTLPLNETVAIQKVTGVTNAFSTVGSLYPNPFNGQTILTLNSSDMFSMRIIDMQGNIVRTYEKLSPNSEIAFGDELRTGIYFANIFNDSNNYTIKIVKIQ